MARSFTFGLLLLICDLVCSYQYFVSVDYSQGHDNSSCLAQNSVISCQTLEYVENHLKSVTSNSVLIEIFQPGINLSKAIHFTDFVNLSIQGHNSSDPIEIVCNTSNAGLSFVNVYGLSLSHINISNCGVGRWNYNIFIEVTEYSALHIINCCDVNIKDTTVYRSKGTGISLLDTYGTVSIESTTAVENSFTFDTNCSESVCEGGRGLHLLFYTTSNPATSIPHMKMQYNNANYTIHNFMSIGNNATTTTKNQSTLCGYTGGSGGGALIYLGENITDVNIMINDSVFQENNAHCGGGLFLAFNSYNKNIQVSLTRTQFSSNHVGTKGTVAGGLLILFLGSLKGNLKTNKLRLFSCTFENNTEGGVNIWSDNTPTEGSSTKAIFFTNCSWTENSATNCGAAVHIMAGVLVSGIRGNYPAVVFNNCTFSSNKVQPVEVQESNLLTQTNAVGAFYSNVVSVVFEGKTIFEDNMGTALYLSSSIAAFSAASNVTFVGNYGKNGGAIALIGRSYLYLNGSSNFYFINNTATRFGGGIYFRSVDTIVYQPCFIMNTNCNEKSMFYFDGNNAIGGQGKHIFVSSLDGCSLSRCNLCQGTKPTDLLKCIGDFTFKNPHNKTIGTLPTNFSLNTKIMTLYPGISQQFNLIAYDAEGNIVPNVSYQATLSKNSSVIRVDSHYQYVSNNTISIDGEPGKNDTLQLNALSTDISLLINVSLFECPPGYVFDKTTITCNCRALDYYGILKCDPEAYIRRGVWMGKCNGSGILCTADCPIGFCTYNIGKLKLYQRLPMNVSHLEQALCSSSRKGILCGSCKKGYSVYYNSWNFKCVENKHCHLGPLFFVLSTIIPLTILFAIIVLLDTNFASGWNGFLLFAQVVCALSLYGNGTIRYTWLQFKVLRGIMYIIALINLEFFKSDNTSFCVWRGANFMDIQMVKLVSIAFALVLIFLCVWIFNQRRIMRFFPCLLRRRYTVINGISAFFILCYSECVDTCFKILKTTCLIDVNNNCVRNVALYSGDMEAFGNPHLKYAVVAVFFIVFIVILPPILLLLYPLLFKLLGLCQLSESKVAIFLWRIMPIQILDSFQNPFKDEYRFFAGLYLLYRALILTVRVNAQTFLNSYAAIELTLGSITVLHAVFQPYKKRVHNIIDLLLFYNLAFLNGIVQYTYTSFTEETIIRKKGGTILFWTTLELLLLLTPLVCMVAYLATKLMIQLKVWKTLRKGYRAIQSVT